VQDLSRDAQTGAKAYLVPSSMQGGNTVSDDPTLSMTAPGSVSILPVPDKTDHLPLPEWSGDKIPVSFPGDRDRVTVESASSGGGRWQDAHDIPAASRWKETS
jgi:hypothetical protein